MLNFIIFINKQVLGNEIRTIKRKPNKSTKWEAVIKNDYYRD